MNKLKHLISLILLTVCVAFTACKNDANINTENTKKLIRINPVVQTAKRTAIEEIAEDELPSVESLSSFYLNMYLNEEDCISNNSDAGWGTYSSLADLQNQNIQVYAGTYYFKLQAYSNALNRYFESVICAEVSEENSTLSFNLIAKNNSTWNGNDGYIELKFYFPEETNPVLKSVNYKGFNSRDVVTSEGSFGNCVEYFTENEVPVAKLDLSLSAGNTGDYYFIDCVFIDENDEDGVQGIFQYTTSVSPMAYKTSKEEFTVEKFLPVQTITYHLTDATLITDENDNTFIGYYSPIFGFEFYSNRNYNWYKDKECTQRADNQALANTGNIDLYWTAEKNTRKLTIKDLDGNVILEKDIYNGTSFYLYDEYVWFGEDDSKTIYKEEYYSEQFYRDIDRINSFYKNNASYLESDLTIYGDFRPLVHLYLYELNSLSDAEPVHSGIIKNGYYYLYPNQYNTASSSYYYNFYVLDYYSDEAGTNPIKTMYSNGNRIQFNTDTDVILYVKKDVPHILTLKNIISKETICTLTIRLGELIFTETGVSTYNNSYYITGLYKFYADENAETEIEIGTELDDCFVDKTVYVHCYDYATIKSTKDEEKLWTSDTITDESGEEVLTGYYSYTAEFDGTYAVYLSEGGNKDNYFYIFINGRYDTATDDPYGERIVYSLEAGDVITIKHTLYNQNHRYGGGDNMDPIPNYATNVYDSDEMRIEISALPSLD